MRLAEVGLEELKKEVDALIVIPNDRLLAVVNRETTVTNAFAMCDDILKQAVEGISDLITTPGIINVDFADIRAVMENAGSALMGIGIASGEKRAEEAAKLAINSPLLDISINGAKGVLFAVAGGEDLGLLEIQDAAKIITESIDPNAKVIFGTSRDNKLKKGELRITVIASGFPETSGSRVSNPLFQFGKGKDDEKKEQIFVPAQADAKREPSEAPRPAAETGADDDWGAVPAFLRRSKLK